MQKLPPYAMGGSLENTYYALCNILMSHPLHTIKPHDIIQNKPSDWHSLRYIDKLSVNWHDIIYAKKKYSKVAKAHLHVAL